jgi:hypothetical protein
MRHGLSVLVVLLFTALALGPSAASSGGSAPFHYVTNQYWWLGSDLPCGPLSSAAREPACTGCDGLGDPAGAGCMSDAGSGVAGTMTIIMKDQIRPHVGFSWSLWNPVGGRECASGHAVDWLAVDVPEGCTAVSLRMDATATVGDGVVSWTA